MKDCFIVQISFQSLKKKEHRHGENARPYSGMALVISAAPPPGASAKSIPHSIDAGHSGVLSKGVETKVQAASIYIWTNIPSVWVVKWRSTKWEPTPPGSPLL